MVKHSVLRPLILLHRYFGVAFCLLFAMWFASGIVMHFVQFPALSESERVAGLPPIDLMRGGRRQQNRRRDAYTPRAAKRRAGISGVGLLCRQNPSR
jgi:hypothetical protein